MHFDDRMAERAAGVVQRDGGMRQRTGVEDEAAALRAALLDPVHEHAFVVRLLEDHAEAVGFGPGRGELADVGQARRPIDLRLALAKKVEVGPVQDIYR